MMLECQFPPRERRPSGSSRFWTFSVLLLVFTVLWLLALGSPGATVRDRELIRRGVDKGLIMQMDEIYREMEMRNRAKVSQNGFSNVDTFLQHQKKPLLAAATGEASSSSSVGVGGSVVGNVGEELVPDTRRCYALYTIMDMSNTRVSSCLASLVRDLYESFDDQVIYILGSESPPHSAVNNDWMPVEEDQMGLSDVLPKRPDSPASAVAAGTGHGMTTDALEPLPGQLHTTFMQLVSFADYPKTMPELLSDPKLATEYEKVIQEELHASLPSPYSIIFTDIMAVPTGLLLIGYPTTDLNAAREHLRSSLNSKGLPVKEPFKNDIVHATLLRVCNPLTPERTRALQRLVDRHDRQCSEFATVNVDHISVSPASWRMRKNELPQNGTVVVNL